MYELFLFDLDGTLTDPKPGITRSVQYALAKMGIQVDDLDSLIPFIGPPLAESFREFYGMTPEQAEKSVAYYREYFSAGGLFENAVYPGIPELLMELRSAGKRLMVATSKPTVFSVKIVEHFGLAKYFDAVVGSNLDGTRVAKAEVIAAALAEAPEFTHTQTIMIGDRKHDVIGARANGIYVVSVGYGYGSAEELRDAKADHHAETVEELREILLMANGRHVG